MQIHPSGRIIVLERECDWRQYLFKIEKEQHLTGWIWFVIYAELFSGNFRLECVHSNNKYMQQGYLSTFFFKPELPVSSKSSKNAPFLDCLEETLSEDEDEEYQISNDASDKNQLKILGGIPKSFATRVLDEGEQTLGVLKNFSAFRYRNKNFRKLLPPQMVGLKGKDLDKQVGDGSILFVDQRGKSAVARDLTALVTLAESAVYS